MPMDSSNQSRVGILTFSNAVDQANVVPLGYHTDSAQLSQRIKSLPFVGGNTNMTGAIRYAFQMLQAASASGRSTPAQPIIVLLTDGVNNVDDDPIQMSRVIKQAGMQLLVVGVTEYVDEAELSEMVTTPARYSYLHANDFSHLNLLVSQLLNRLICTPPPSTYTYRLPYPVTNL